MERKKKKKKALLTRRSVGLNPLLQFLHVAARGHVSFSFLQTSPGFLALPRGSIQSLRMCRRRCGVKNRPAASLELGCQSPGNKHVFEADAQL